MIKAKGSRPAPAVLRPLPSSPSSRQLAARAPRVERAGDSDLERLGGLVAELAHEARNPLASILAGLEAWQSEPDAGFDVYGERIRRDARRLLGLMQDLLELATPTRRRRKAVSMRLLIEEVVCPAAPAAAARGIEIETVVAPGGGLVEGDPVSLARALGNVVDNALQHVPDGGRVRVAVRSSGGWVELTVADSGPGFPPAELDRVFEPFFSRRRGGSGLGLAIVRRIVSDHGGRIAVANPPDGGAEVTVHLPALESGG